MPLARRRARERMAPRSPELSEEALEGRQGGSLRSPPLDRPTAGRWPMLVGRYELHGELASGGMAVVHLGQVRGDAGFTRPVAIKRLHRQFVGDSDMTAMLLDEARLASRLRHPNVVAPLDVVQTQGELFVVMEYVHGLTIAHLVREAHARREPVPLPIVARIATDVLAGLHAAHEATDSANRPLALVHRDVSPQNVMVGTDGLSRVLDFGIAQAAIRSQTTRKGKLRAKLAYAAPEHVLDRVVDRRADIYSTAIVCWELLTLERLFSASNESALLARVLEHAPPPASMLRAEVPPELDALLLAALSKDPAARPASAEAFALAVERLATPATHRDVARWMAALGARPLERLAERKAELENGAVEDDTPSAFVASVATRTRAVALPETGTRRRRGPEPRSGGGLSHVLVLAVAILAGAMATEGKRFLARVPAPPAVDAVGAAASAPPLPPAGAAPPSAPGPAVRALPAQARVAFAPPTAAASAEGKRSAAGPQPTVRPPSRHLEDECAQLTEVDAYGIRRVKRQCLR